MADLVLDVAERFGCRRVYTSGAAVALTHHALKPRVWAVTSREHLIKEVRNYENTILMGEIEGRGDQGSITGLNGLLLGLAKKRGFEAICLMGRYQIISREPHSPIQGLQNRYSRFSPISSESRLITVPLMKWQFG